MIPLPGLLIIIWIIRVSGALFVISGLVSIVALRMAHSSWRVSRPAAAAERLALTVLVPDLVFFVLFLSTNPRLLILTSIPGLVALATLGYVRLGNRRRGHLSLGRRGVVRPVLASLAGTALLLIVVTIGIRAAQTYAQRLHAAEIARGQRNQDEFIAVVASDRGIVVAGSTSTPPAMGDDAWMLALDSSLAIQRSYSPLAPKRQALFALATDGEDLIAGGRDDEHPFWLRFNKAGAVTGRKLLQEQGTVHALASPGKGVTLVAGERNDTLLIAGVDANGSELWSISPNMKGSLLAVVTDGRRFLATGPDDPLAMPGCTTILVGGTTDGKTSWARKLSQSRFSPESHALVVMPGGSFLVLGTTGERTGRMADLWLARVAEDGTVSDERTFGGEPVETAGGLAVLGARVFVAGYRFSWPREELWLFELDAKGNKVWEKTYDARSYGRPLALAATPEGHLVIAGYRQGADLHRDGWVAVFDTSGRLLMQRTYP